MKLQVKELRRLKENRNKASGAGRAAKIVKFAQLYTGDRMPK